jgi:hypothetical protein
MWKALRWHSPSRRWERASTTSRRGGDVWQSDHWPGEADRVDVAFRSAPVARPCGAVGPVVGSVKTRFAGARPRFQPCILRCRVCAASRARPPVAVRRGDSRLTDVASAIGAQCGATFRAARATVATFRSIIATSRRTLDVCGSVVAVCGSIVWRCGDDTLSSTLGSRSRRSGDVG